MTNEELLRAKIPCPETGIEIKKSMCCICANYCGLSLSVKDGVIIKTEGNKENPHNCGALCAKGAATRQYVYSPKRLKTPMKRVGERGEGKFEPISWEEAMQLIGKEIGTVKEKYGPQSVVFASGLVKHLHPFLRRIAMLFGSSAFLTEASVCAEAMYMCQKMMHGGRDVPDIANANCIMVWSTNPYYTAITPGMSLSQAKDRGAKIIAIDPRITPVTSMADIHLQLRPGTDGALAWGMANVIITKNLVDQNFIDNHTYGYEQYKEYALNFSVEKAAQITGVPAELIVEAAVAYATADGASIMHSASPVVHHTNGINNQRAAFCLEGLTGNVDRVGGQRLVNVTYQNTGGFKTNMEAFSRPYEWHELPPRIGVGRYPVWDELQDEDGQGMDLVNQIRTGKPYPLKALIACGFHHRMQPDPETYISAIQEMDFIVVSELFESDMVRYADVVLPACSSVERSELRAYGDGRLLVTSPAIEPLFQSRPDVEIALDIAKAIGIDDPMLNAGYDACLNYILEPCRVTVEELRKHPNGYQVDPDCTNPIPLGSLRENGFKTISGKFEFVSKVLEKYQHLEGHDPLPIYKEPMLSPISTPELYKEYDLVLCTGSRHPMLVHSRMYHVGWTNVLMPRGLTVDMNPADGAKRGICTGDKVKLRTQKGSITVTAFLTEAAQPGVVHIFHGNRNADINELLSLEHYDPVSGYPGYKSSLCAVEKA